MLRVTCAALALLLLVFSPGRSEVNALSTLSMCFSNQTTAISACRPCRSVQETRPEQNLVYIFFLQQTFHHSIAQFGLCFMFLDQRGWAIIVRSVHEVVE